MSSASPGPYPSLSWAALERPADCERPNENVRQYWLLRVEPAEIAAAVSASVVVATIDAALERLHDSVRRTKPGNSIQDWVIEIPPAGPRGFAIELRKQDEFLDGSFGGLHESFATVAQALEWVRRALSRSYHLRVIRYGDQPSEWYLEPTAVGGGGEALAVGHVAPWRSWLLPKSSEVRWNALPLD